MVLFDQADSCPVEPPDERDEGTVQAGFLGDGAEEHGIRRPIRQGLGRGAIRYLK